MLKRRPDIATIGIRAMGPALRSLLKGSGKPAVLSV
jgi:hypothetical protein